MPRPKKITKKPSKIPYLKQILIGSGILIIVLILIINKLTTKKFAYKNIDLYKDGVAVNLIDKERRQIVKYVEKESLEKANNVCEVSDEYKLVIDDIEIRISEECGAYFQNNYTMENYKINISDEFKNYIIDISK